MIRPLSGRVVRPRRAQVRPRVLPLLRVSRRQRRPHETKGARERAATPPMPHVPAGEPRNIKFLFHVSLLFCERHCLWIRFPLCIDTVNFCASTIFEYQSPNLPEPKTSCRRLLAINGFRFDRLFLRLWPSMNTLSAPAMSPSPSFLSPSLSVSSTILCRVLPRETPDCPSSLSAAWCLSCGRYRQHHEVTYTLCD